jgi:hypothetical protein
MKKTRWFPALCLAVLGTVGVAADTLIFRDGRRVDGELIAVNAQRVEFRERRGGNRVLRVSRDEVRAIELDNGPRDDDDPRGVRPGRARGLREREVVVSGDVPFVDTGIDIGSGQQMYFESIGNVWWKRNEKTGPAGVAGSERDRDSRRPMSRRPTAALIGKVGQDSVDLFFIGDESGPIRARSSGRLFLGVNDDYVQDNHGNFRVVVHY